MLHNLPTKEVPKELIISSKSIRLLDAVGQGILSNVTLYLNSLLLHIIGLRYHRTTTIKLSNRMR